VLVELAERLLPVGDQRPDIGMQVVVELAVDDRVRWRGHGQGHPQTEYDCESSSSHILPLPFGRTFGRAEMISSRGDQCLNWCARLPLALLTHGDIRRRGP